MQIIHFNGKKVGFTEQGKGTPIILLHGFCEDSRMWDDFLTQFPRRRIIRIDLPGFGQTELQEEHTISAMTHCVKAVIDHLDIKKCIIIGHSMGGYVSLDFVKQ